MTSSIMTKDEKGAKNHWITGSYILLNLAIFSAILTQYFMHLQLANQVSNLESQISILKRQKVKISCFL